MKTEKCNDCGDDILDCDCDGLKEWFCVNEIKPSSGQKCRVRCEQIVDAYFSHREKKWSFVKKHARLVPVAWRPLYSEPVNGDV